MIREISVTADEPGLDCEVELKFIYDTEQDNSSENKLHINPIGGSHQGFSYLCEPSVCVTFYGSHERETFARAIIKLADKLKAEGIGILYNNEPDSSTEE